MDYTPVLTAGERECSFRQSRFYRSSCADRLHLAEQVAMLDRIASGTMHYGAVIGYRERELAAFGVDMDDHISRFMESLSLLKQLWRSAEPVTHHGEFYDCEEVFISPRPPISDLVANRQFERRSGHSGVGDVEPSSPTIKSSRDFQPSGRADTDSVIDSRGIAMLDCLVRRIRERETRIAPFPSSLTGSSRAVTLTYSGIAGVARVISSAVDVAVKPSPSLITGATS